MMTGVGGDAFALVASAAEGRVVGLNGSGRAPAAATADAYRARGLTAIAPGGILSATVPGAVHAWESLSQRFGALPLATALEPAIRAAEDGFPVTEIVAHTWFLLERMGVLRNEAARASWLTAGRAPRPGEWFRAPGLARTLRQIADGGAASFYEGEAAKAIVAASREQDGFFEMDDLARHRGAWVEPIATTYRGVEVLEIPPNGQGIAALQALAILECFEPAASTSALDWHRRIEAVKVAFADRAAYVADPEHEGVPIEALLDKGYARRRAGLIGDRALEGVAAGLESDTTYLCAADEHGNLVSFIQSLFTGFGSGIGCGDTGIVLQSRGAGFVLDAGHPNCLAPNKRPFHTIIPGMLRRDGVPSMAFGLMGGDVQPQSHLNFVANLVDHGLSPQEAIDRPRFRFQGARNVAIEAPQLRVDEGGTLGDALAARGHEVIAPGEAMADVFGGGQAVALEADGLLVGASDRRKDGCALGFWD
jgi:gamma-glutamyltranspeptidase/glutathione hydrolase